MRRLIYSTLINIMFFLLVSCGGRQTVHGNGNFVTQSRSFPNIEKIAVYGHFQLNIQKADQQEIQVTTDENLQPLISMRIENNVVVVSILHGYDIVSSKPIVINIKMQNLKGLYIAGTNEIHAQGISGNSLQLNMNGENKVTLNGVVREAKFHITGIGQANASQLQTNDTVIEISGDALARVWVTDSLTARITGSGLIYYSGTPKDIKQSVMGSGKVIPTTSFH